MGASQNQNSHSNQNFNENEVTSSRSNSPPQIKWTRDHPFEFIIWDASARVKMRRTTQEKCLYNSFLSQ